MNYSQRNQLILNTVIFLGTLLIPFVYYYFFDLSLSIGYKLLGGLIILGLSLAMIKSRKFLIFSTALFLMLTATQFGAIKNIMETVRWIPYIIFVFIFFSRLFITKELPRKIERFDILLFIMIVMMFLSAFYSIDPAMTIKRAGTFLLLYISVFWVIYPEIHSKKDAEKTINLLLYATFVPYSISMILVFFPDISLHGDRFMGYFLNPNTIGILTGIILPLVLWKTICKNKLWAKILLVFVLLSLFLSGSRSGLLGSVIGGGYYIFMTKKKYRIPTVFLSLLIIIVMFTFGDIIQRQLGSYLRISGLFRGTTELNIVSSGRVEKWKTMVSLIKKRPLLGYGFGTEDLLFRHFGLKFETPGLYAHNTFLGMAVQMGVLGFILFFSPLFYLLFRSSKTKDNLVYALNGMIIGGLTVGFFESWIYSVGSAFAFPFWVGIVILLRLKKR